MLSVALLALTCAVPEVKAVRFEGLERIQAGDITSGLQLRPPKGIWPFRTWVEFDRLALELDRRRVETFLRLHGYFDARVDDVSVEGDEKITITYHLEQGPPGRLKEVAFSGAQDIYNERQLERRAGLPLEKPLVYQRYTEGKDRIRRGLLEKGRAHARVEGVIEVLRDAAASRVVYTLEPGPPVRFGPLRLVGTSSVPESAIRNRVAWNEGELFDPRLLELTEGRLYQLDLIGSVQLEWPSSGKEVPISLGVSDAVPREVRVGGGVARDNVNWELRLRGEYRQADFFHPLQALRLELRPSLAFQEDLLEEVRPNIEALASVTRDDFFIARVRAELTAGYALTQLEGVQVTGPRVSFGLQRAFLLDRLILRGRVHFDAFFVGLDDVDAALEEASSTFGLSPFAPLLYFTTSLRFDGRDRPVQPRKGGFAELGLELGRELDDGGYVKVEPELRGYVPLSPSTVLTGRVQLGTSFGGELPVTRRYFSGGASAHRGFPSRRLAPTLIADDGDRNPLGGNHELELNFEVRQDLFEVFNNMLGIVAFMDGGDVTLSLDEIDPSNLHWAPGFGLRYRTPVGPIRFDIGYRLTRSTDVRPADGFLERISWHLTLGEAF